MRFHVQYLNRILAAFFILFVSAHSSFAKTETRLDVEKAIEERRTEFAKLLATFEEQNSSLISAIFEIKRLELDMPNQEKILIQKQGQFEIVTSYNAKVSRPYKKDDDVKNAQGEMDKAREDLEDSIKTKRKEESRKGKLLPAAAITRGKLKAIHDAYNNLVNKLANLEFDLLRRKIEEPFERTMEDVKRTCVESPPECKQKLISDAAAEASKLETRFRQDYEQYLGESFRNDERLREGYVKLVTKTVEPEIEGVVNKTEVLKEGWLGDTDIKIMTLKVTGKKHLKDSARDGHVKRFIASYPRLEDIPEIPDTELSVVAKKAGTSEGITSVSKGNGKESSAAKPQDNVDLAGAVTVPSHLEDKKPEANAWDNTAWRSQTLSILNGLEMSTQYFAVKDWGLRVTMLGFSWDDKTRTISTKTLEIQKTKWWWFGWEPLGCRDITWRATTAPFIYGEMPLEPEEINLILGDCDVGHGYELTIYSKK